MKRVSWLILFAGLLVSASIIVFILQIIIFKRIGDTGFYLLQDLAFVFLNVLLVTLVIDQLLRTREKREMISKLNMIIGVFFSEVGQNLMKDFFVFDSRIDNIRNEMFFNEEWGDKDFLKVKKFIQTYETRINSRNGDLDNLSAFLLEKRELILSLLENPNLLEHEKFTDLLRAIFHLMEELTSRQDLVKLAEPDYDHLSNDIKRAYILLMIEWLEYNKHLKHEYPYLFSLAVRMNPFNPHAKSEVAEK